MPHEHAEVMEPSGGKKQVVIVRTFFPESLGQFVETGLMAELIRWSRLGPNVLDDLRPIICSGPRQPLFRTKHAAAAGKRTAACRRCDYRLLAR